MNKETIHTIYKILDSCMVIVIFGSLIYSIIVGIPIRELIGASRLDWWMLYFVASSYFSCKNN